MRTSRILAVAASAVCLLMFATLVQAQPPGGGGPGGFGGGFGGGGGIQNELDAARSRSVQQVLDRVRDTVDDARVEIRVLGKAFEPSPVSSARSPAYVHLAKTIRSIYPDTVVAPYLVPGATDARHYAPIAQDVYRFLPLPLNTEDLARLHGVNERISLDDYAKLIQFYAQLIATLD